MPNKLLGQHFLKNAAIIRKIVQAAAPARGETMIEIGPGNGELTVPLAAACAAAGCGLIAIEKDTKLAARLEEKVNARILAGDALTLLPSVVPASPEEKYKITGNIPYYITGHLMRIISEFGHRPKRCVFTVQKEVAERIVARPPHMNRLAASVQFWAAPEIIEVVGKENFVPTPKVDSAILLLESLGSGKSGGRLNENERPDPERYYATVRALFAQPRKTILNNLAAADDKQEGKKGKDAALRTLQEAGIDPGLRPQNLTIENILFIATRSSSS